MIEVELPDGTIAEFPKGTSQEIIKGALQKRYGAPSPKQGKGGVVDTVRRSMAGTAAGILERVAGAEQSLAGAQRKDEISGQVRKMRRNTKETLGRAGEMGAAFGKDVLPYFAAPAAGSLLGAAAIGGATSAGLNTIDVRNDGAGIGQRIGENVYKPENIIENATAAAGGGAGFKAAQMIGRGINKFRGVGTNTDNLVGDVASGVNDLPIMSRAQGDVQSSAKAAKAIMKTKYGAAERASDGVKVGGVPELKQRLAIEMDNALDDDAISVFANAMRKLDSNAKRGKIDINKIISIQRGASSASAGGGSKAFAGGKVRQITEEYLDDALASGGVKGSDESIGLWKDAVGTARKYYQTFDVPKQVKAAVSNSEQPAEVFSQSVFSGNSVSTAKNASKVYDDMVNAGARPQELKKAVVSKMFRTSMGRMPSGEEALDDAVWMRGLANEIGLLKRNNMSLWNKFSKTEQKTLSGFESALRKADEPAIVNKLLAKVNEIGRNNPVAKYQIPTMAAQQTHIPAIDALRILDSVKAASGKSTPASSMPDLMSVVSNEGAQGSVTANSILEKYKTK